MKLSLIFCCYNVSKYLDSIYNLLKAQPYKDIEVIFVEDCSTDDTKEKLKSFLIDPRIQLIENQVNLGASESRNVGLRVATGDYVGFPDSDDLFDIDWFVKVAEVIRMHKPTVIVCGMREDYEKSGVLEYSKNITSKYTGVITNEYVDALIDLEDTLLFGYMNNKIYSMHFLKENAISCKKMALKEDFEFNITVFNKISSFYILNEPLYFYKKRTGGNTLTSKYVNDYFEIHKNAVLLLKELIESKVELSEESKKLLVNRFFRYLLSAIERNTNSKSMMTIIEQVKWIKQINVDPNCQWFFLNINYMSGKMKILKLLFKYQYSYILVLIGHGLRFTKDKLPILFAKIKS
ncbi:glycosyltransferase family 2 protein [Kluyvera intermedia]|uniref:Glycosyltransferase family 2 protein n=1 Tax=Kluyvera intermedia TaxID=61648 RepID=A0AA95G0V2_KLUIN|nr:glycosyltransferase family 2 protein [Kluyvera intermedia]WGL57714.1 glycosyltransferase family 2 protein [Kluyvera intermedia]